MNSIEQVKYEMSFVRKEIRIQERIFDAECRAKASILDSAEKWVKLIEDEIKKKYPQEGKE